MDITTVDFDKMTLAIERALGEKHEISLHQSPDERREELKAAREEVFSDPEDSEGTVIETGDFEFPAAFQ